MMVPSAGVVITANGWPSPALPIGCQATCCMLSLKVIRCRLLPDRPFPVSAIVHKSPQHSVLAATTLLPSGDHATCEYCSCVSMNAVKPLRSAFSWPSAPAPVTDQPLGRVSTTSLLPSGDQS